MKNKSFISQDGLVLIVKSRKSAVIFELEQNQPKEFNFIFNFDVDTFKSLFLYIESEAKESWKDVILKETDSLGSDYCEYYDKELDSEGSLEIVNNDLKIERPALESKRLYQFNKSKIQSFLYDFKNKLNINKKD